MSFTHVSLVGLFSSDTTRMVDIKTRVLAGDTISILDIFILIIGKSALAVTALNALIDGGGEKELIALKISSTYYPKLIAIYNAEVPVIKYQAKLGQDVVTSDILYLDSFVLYLKSLNASIPTLAQLTNYSLMTSDVKLQMRDWYLNVYPTLHKV